MTTTSSDSSILRTDSLTKRYGGFVAIDSVDFSVTDGEIRSIIGPNGAGKTTFFNLLSGMTDVTAGTIEFRGSDITSLAPAEIARAGISRSFQITNIFGDFTVRENLQLVLQGAYVEELGSVNTFLKPTEELTAVNERAEELLNQLGLAEMGDKLAQNLSHGDQRRLDLGVALAADPDVILLDEPMAGVGATEKQETVAIIEDVLADKTVLLVEHEMNLVMEISDRITVLHQGSVIADGEPEEIAADPEVREAYLGEV
jgi:branched-chain amino acid transport system ATP-binding protein